MKKLKPVIIILIMFCLGSIISSLYHHESIVSNFPWPILLVVAFAYITLLLKISIKVSSSIVFLTSLILQRIYGGYYNWTSWIIFAVVSALYTLVFLFIYHDINKTRSNQLGK